jgi:archaellin
MIIMMTMVKIHSLILLVAIIGLAVITSGCTGGQDVTSVVKALPEVQQFMNEHPNAKITVTYWSKEEVSNSSQEISQQCDKSITPAAMYKATVSEGDLKIVSWINAENQIVVCSTTTGGASPIAAIPTVTQTSQPITTTGRASPTVTPNQGTQANKFEILNLDVQQVILSDSEIKEVIGSDWEKTNQTKVDTPDHGQLMDLGYQTINSNTRDKEDIIVRVGVSSKKETFGISNMPGNDIDIGDAGKVITESNYVEITFIKNNILVVIAGSTTVGLETITKLARKQEEKIIRLLENPASAFTPIPTMVVPTPVITKKPATAISENINVIAIDGQNGGGILTSLNITLIGAAGSSTIDLSKVLLKVQGQPYNYSASASGAAPSTSANTFSVYTLRLSNAASTALTSLGTNTWSTVQSPMLGSGDLARLDVGVAGLGLGQNTPIQLSLTPANGATVTNPVTLPAFTSTNISIYP